MLTRRPPPPRWQVFTALLVGAGIALVLVQIPVRPGPSPKGVIVERVLAKVQSSFVDELLPGRVDEAFYDGLDKMVRQFDRNTRYVPPDRVRDFEGDTEGTYIGIGVVLSQPDPVFPRVTNVITGGPAELAGLRKGDLLEAIADTDLTGSSLEEINRLIQGDPRTEVSLRVARENSKPLTLVVRRDSVKTSSLGGVRLYPASPDRAPAGYVRISQFQDRTGDDLHQACAELQHRGARALVLDLRGNGGGVLQQAVRVAGLFTAPGHLLTTRGRSDIDKPRMYRAEETGQFTAWPLVVLVDGGSASASEIVSAALRDHERALLVGTETYGKWTVQTIFRLGDHGEDGILKLTTRRYYPPLGLGVRRSEEDGHRLGLRPDVAVETADEVLARLHQQWQEEQIGRINDPLRVDEQAQYPAEREPLDLPLVRALELLRDPVGHRKLVADQRLRWLAEESTPPGDGPHEVAKEGETSSATSGQ